MFWFSYMIEYTAQQHYLNSSVCDSHSSSLSFPSSVHWCVPASHCQGMTVFPGTLWHFASCFLFKSQGLRPWPSVKWLTTPQPPALTWHKVTKLHYAIYQNELVAGEREGRLGREAAPCMYTGWTRVLWPLTELYWSYELNVADKLR